MFGLSPQRGQDEVQNKLRRIYQLTIPNNAMGSEFLRADNRFNRVIPTLIWPCVDGQINPQEGVIAITRDVSDIGVGLVIDKKAASGDVVVAFWLPMDEHPQFFHGRVQRSDPIGGGYWVMGVEITKPVPSDPGSDVHNLVPLARLLLPTQEALCPA